MFLIMGFIHLFACVVTIVFTPDNLQAIWAHFIAGVIEVSIGLYYYLKEEFI
jgi:hypothetical protein